jgi:UDP-N-acetylmuramoyl-tripeptide--D-alanyl-D-alanine ligase
MANHSISSKLVRESLGLTGAGPDFVFTSVTSDSRKAAPGCLFVAIPGDAFDGHDFIKAAIEKGARGVLSTRGKHGLSADFLGSHRDVEIFEVPDSVEGYRKLGAAWRSRFKIPLVAIAGSEGKTTTKEFLAAILAGRWPRVLKTEGSQNGYVGIPMTLLELSGEHGAAVIEVGIDEIGAMARHMEIVRPTAALLTSIGPEHLEKLKDVATVAREEGIALEFTARSGGTVAISLDDPGISPHWKSIGSGSKLAYTLSSATAASVGCAEKALIGEPLASLTELQVTAPKWGKQIFPQPLPGRHNASNLLAALSIAHALGLTPDEARAGLATFKGAEGRSQIRQLPGDVSVVCDYYNANPTSIRAGISLFGELSKKNGAGSHLCIADMLELGPDEERFHRELAPVIQPFGALKTAVYLYGPRMKWLEAELKAQGYPGALEHFATHAELAAKLKSSLRPRDTVLLKGSRGMKMEQVWKALSAG